MFADVSKYVEVECSGGTVAVCGVNGGGADHGGGGTIGWSVAFYFVLFIYCSKNEAHI